MLKADYDRAHDLTVEVKAMKIAGAGYIRRVVALLNNMSSALAPELVGVENEDDAKERIDDYVAKALAEWKAFDVEKLAKDERERNTHRRSGNRSWRTETKK